MQKHVGELAHIGTF